MAADGADGSCPESQEDVAAAEAARALVDYMEDLEEDDSTTFTKGRNNRLDVHDEVENFYLQSGAGAVSIMQLPLYIGDEVVSEGEEKEIYLVGQSVSESREIRYLAEKWKLDLHPNFSPAFLVKTAFGWIRVQKPKVVYRKIMTDGLTLAHFLHYVRKHPSASASTTRDYLANEFRHFEEKPSPEKLSDFLPIIRRYLKADMGMENPSILREFFSGHFSDVVPSCTIREIKKRSREDERSTAGNSCSIDLNVVTIEEVKRCEKQGVKSTSNSKTTRSQHASVQAELRNLHSQWCSLLGGRATVKADKKAVSNKRRTSERQNPPSRKSERQKFASKKSGSQSPLSKKAESQNNLPKKGRPSVADRKISQSKMCQKSQCNSPVSKKGRPSGTHRRDLTSIPSLESQTPTFDQHEKSKRLAKLANAQNSEEKAVNLKRRKGEIKPASSDSEKSPGLTPSRVMVGVHSPSTDLFDRLEDPPICTICDDGGDLICCEGPCQRHFHATPGADTSCKTLGLTSAQVKKIDIYYCKNCLLKQHQCFICQELGSSAPHGPQEVYICDAPGCRKFYHASCVAKVLDPELDWRAMAERIERGLHGFLCPRHCCAVCTSKEIQPGIFVQCRRCPKAWHRDCLTDFPFSGEIPTTSIWKHYEREFIYCKEHKILPHILTPTQDHLRFPE